MTEEIHFGRNDVELSSTTWAYDETTCNHKLRHIDEEGAISSSEDIIILQDKINPIPSVFDHFNKKRSALVDTSYFYLHANDPDGVYMHGISYVVDYEFNGNEAPVLQTRKYLNVTDPDTFASFEYYQNGQLTKDL